MKFTKFISSIFLMIAFVSARNWDFEKSIFCTGRLLHDVQMLELLGGQREFLELKLKRSGEAVMRSYRDLRPKIKIKQPEGREALKEFITNNFQNVTTLEPHVPIDWKSQFPLLHLVNDNQARDMLRRMNRNLIKFSRVMKSEVRENLTLYSYLPVPFPFFIAYLNENQLTYRDSYWVMEALLACDMLKSAKRLLLNLISLVVEVGHVPPENRIFFVNRCAPPILPLMLHRYFQETKDFKFVKKYFRAVEHDYLHWFGERSQIVRTPFHIFLCVTEEKERLRLPRPEKYLEDMTFKKKPPRGDLDFSFVWWDSPPPVSTVSIRSTSITEWSARVLAEFSKEYGSYDHVDMYYNISKQMVNTIDNLLYTSEGGWKSFDPKKGQVGRLSLWPVYSGSHELINSDVLPDPITAEEYLIAVRILLSNGRVNDARELATKWVLIQRGQADTSLINTCVTILMIKHFPEISIPPETEDINYLNPICAVTSILLILFNLYSTIEKLVLTIF
ncbi:trehalase-like [Cimex lectularius]|uniref:Trehalase n=1 Tax=Cimex lectularius TaxID=79782 RepID=A0A8I6RLF0_CIMLE|nr:trehalase-like [Cimex lectularius]